MKPRGQWWKWPNEDPQWERCQLVETLGCSEAQLSQKCATFQNLSPKEREKIILDNNMCPFCLGCGVDQE
jgi:hypothetical protein